MANKTTNPSKNRQQTVRNTSPLVMALAALLILPSLASGGVSTDTDISYSYTAGGSTELGECMTFEANGTVFCPMGGGIVCGTVHARPSDEVPFDAIEAIDPIDAAVTVAGPQAGGYCAPVNIDIGEVVNVTVTDDIDVSTSFAICIDGNNNDVCRPDLGEEHTDTLFISSCSDGTFGSVQNLKAAGNLYIFIMQEPNTDGSASCAATTGMVDIHITPLPLPQCADGIDNDGDGRTDYPADPDCDDLSDDNESPPPPPVVTH